MMKWFKVLTNSKQAIENTFNGTGDEWDACEAEVAAKQAAKDKDAWLLRATMASERFDAECMSNGDEW